MKPEKTRSILCRALPLAAMCLVVCVIVSIGISFGRYQTEKTERFTVEVKKPEELTVSAPQWTAENGGYKTEITIGNASQAEAAYSVSMLASLGIENSRNFTVQLTLRDQTYTAVPEEIAEGSVMYRSFGDGWCYRFVDAAEEKPVWTLPAGGSVTGQLTVMPAGDFTWKEVSLFQIQVAQEK